jgi:WD40 repeat protein
MVKEADKAHERCSRISDTQIPDELLGKNMVFNRLSNVSRLFDTTDIKAVGVGVPSSISATPKFLAIGTSLSNIALFENNAKGFKVLQLSDCPDFGEVTCCNISRDNKYLLCGFSNGFISLWDLTYSTPIKTLPSSLNSPITKLLFWKNTYEEFISSDLDGNVFLYSIEKYVWVSVKNKRLVNRVNGVTYHDVRAGRN